MGRKESENPKSIGIAFRLTKPEDAEVEAAIALQALPPGVALSKHDWARVAVLNWARAENAAKGARPKARKG